MTMAAALARTARNLGAPRAAARRWPRLLLFTDPVRTPNPERLALQLPRGCGVVYRAFGAPDAIQTGRRLAQVCARRGLRLFVGADPALAAACRAQGLHLPERLAGRRGDNLRLSRRFLISAAAHGAPAMRRARLAGVQAVVLSPVFPSASPSAGRPIGALRFRVLARQSKLPAYALGGVDASRSRRLAGSRAVGLAAIGALASLKT